MKTYEERLTDIDRSVSRSWYKLVDAITTADIWGEDLETANILARQRGDKDNPILMKAKEFGRMRREIFNIVSEFQKKL